MQEKPEEAAEFYEEEKKFETKRKETIRNKKPYNIVDKNHPKVVEQMLKFP